MSLLPSHDQTFTVTVDHWRGRRWTFVRHVSLSSEEAKELASVYRAIGYTDERIHITSTSGVKTKVIAA